MSLLKHLYFNNFLIILHTWCGFETGRTAPGLNVFHCMKCFVECVMCFVLMCLIVFIIKINLNFT